MPRNENIDEYKETELCLDEFREKLGKRGLSMSDSQIRDLYDDQCQFADTLLDKWFGEKIDI